MLQLVLTYILSTSAYGVHASINSVGGFYTASDGFQHAVVQTTDDALHEIYFSSKGTWKSDLGCFGHVISTTSFYADDDQTEHVIVAQQGGGLREVFFNSKLGVHQTPPITMIANTKSVAGYYDSNTKNRMVIVGTSSGDVFAIGYSSAHGVKSVKLGSFPGLAAVSGFYSDADKIDHAIVLGGDGSIQELFFNDSIGVHLTLPALVQMPGAVAIGAFYSPADNIGHVVVARRDGSIIEVFYGSQIGVHVTNPPLAMLPSAVSVAAFITPSDKRAHVIVGLAGGDVHEVSYGGPAPSSDALLAHMTTGPQVEEISPDQSNAPSLAPQTGWGGLTVALAGDVSATYAVSLNDGVWKSVANGAWSRLPNSPRFANSIAVDPNAANRIAVGERDGDGSLATNHDGLWLSSDAGATWTYALNPLQQPGCQSQAVPSVAFSSKSTLFLATACGIGRMLKSAAVPDFSTSPSLTGPVTAVAVSESKVWARTATQIGVSNDDGLHWTVRQIPSSFTNDGRGTDAFSLAAFDNAAYASCCTVAYDKYCGNQNQMLVYDAVHDAFLMQPVLWVDHGAKKDPAGNRISQLGCDGTGLGGSRFTKAYSIGGQRHLFYGSAEEVYEATAFDAKGQVTKWEMPLGATCGGCTNQDPVHSDLWDFLLSTNGKTKWVSNDGGVYLRGGTGGWKPHDKGLHTHLPLTLDELRTGDRVRLVYPTPDNDGWTWEASAGAKGWSPDSVCGDENWSAADGANPSVALIVRTPECAYLRSFDDKLPNGKTVMSVALNHGGMRDGPAFFNFIQSLESDTPASLSLDAVMLTNLPLQYKDANGLHDVAGPLGLSPPVGQSNPVIIRAQNYVPVSDVDGSRYAGWSVLANNLPGGAQRFWIGGGHVSPTIYVLATQGSSTSLWKSEALGIGQLTQWQQLNVSGSVLDKKPWVQGPLGSGSCEDPNTFDICRTVFVNPYNPQQLWTLTNLGAQTSTNGGFSFAPDEKLTSLVTGNGRLPLTNDFEGGAGENVRIGSHLDPMATVSSMAFCRTNPDIAAASSAFGGVFFKDESGAWHDLTGLLPKPLTYTTSVQMDCEAIYVATGGGGLFRITGYRAAP